MATKPKNAVERMIGVCQDLIDAASLGLRAYREATAVAKDPNLQNDMVDRAEEAQRDLRDQQKE